MNYIEVENLTQVYDYGAIFHQSYTVLPIPYTKSSGWEQFYPITEIAIFTENAPLVKRSMERHFRYFCHRKALHELTPILHSFGQILHSLVHILHQPYITWCIVLNCPFFK